MGTPELPSSLESSSSSPHKQTKSARHELDDSLDAEIDPYTQSPTKTTGPPLLDAEQMVLIDGSSNVFSVSPPFEEESIKQEMAEKDENAKDTPYIIRQLENVLKVPFIYYSIREYVVRKKGTLDNLLQLIRDTNQSITPRGEVSTNVTRRAVQDHILRSSKYYGVVDEEGLKERVRQEKQNVPSSIHVVKPESLDDSKTVEDEATERRIMNLLENANLAAEGQFDEDEMTFYNPESGANENMNGAIIMTNDELQYYQMLPEEAHQILDDFNFRRIEKYEDFMLAFQKAAANSEEEFNEITLLQILQYRRFENPPPTPENPRELTKEEATDFLTTLDSDLCYYLDLFTHRHIYGIDTIGLLVESQTGEILSEQSVRRLINARRKACPPKGGSQFDVNVTTGYLSHDYWPSLLCVPEGDHEVRFYNLTNTRNDGFLRYYRCSKCCTIKQIPDNFQVPKLQIRGDQVITDWNQLEHYPECKPTPIPVMLAEQLDRRARRQASLGLMAPREAWTEAYFEALRISDAVKQLHPEYPTVAELFPSYDTCRGQYSRSFHKYKRVLSMPPELQRVVHKRKLVTSANSIYEEELVPGDVQGTSSQQFSKRTRGLRRGREADELFQMHVPAGYKREMAAGYVAADEGSNVEYFYVDGDEDAQIDTEFYEDPVDVDQIEQEIVVTAEAPSDEQAGSSQSPKKDAANKEENINVV
ncbi:hypothetical protein M3Y97_00746800 [Aphelenchoides bicaudatus]|nr:hypothetical protein M3Y97_00746800 [Aphelenchoides bicaudatus]